ncbi:hypothetical protein ACL02P_17070 [Paenibacillus sp. MB22_1]|nr:hypothetical protein [Paenibacillus sp. p3-SID1389]MCT2194726.1 hypothetical protein [Paenibacillus sp. p3-SID1389]
MSSEWKDDGTLHLYSTFTKIVWLLVGEVIKMGTLQWEGEIKYVCLKR